MPISPVDCYFDDFNYILEKYYNSILSLSEHDITTLSKLLHIWDTTYCDELDLCRESTCRLASLPSWLSIDGRFPSICDYIENIIYPYEISRTNDIFFVPRLPGSFGSNC